MSKFLTTAATIVGVAALAIGTAGALAPVATATALASVGVTASATALAAGLGAAAAAASFAASALAPKPSNTVNPTEWKADPNAGIPYTMGRTYASGTVIFRTAFGKDNRFQRVHTAYSLGPIDGFEGLYVDRVLTTVTGDVVNISSRGKMEAKTQRGLCPEPAALGWYVDTPGLSAASKASGLAASAFTFIYDTKGGNTFTTEPQTGYVMRGVAVYDPRKDSTYPGGSGPHRIADEATWTWSDNPWLHALSWLIGRRHNGRLTMGVGMAVAGIITSQFVEAANIADANGWKIGGVVTSLDDKWDVLKQMAQAGGGEPLRLAAQVGCLVNTPRVSLATIGVGDVVGEASVQATQSIRDRINAIVPRCRFEDQTWEIDAAEPVIVDEHVAFDGKQRRKEVTYSLVQCFAGEDPTQAVQLARYDIENSREFGPITLPLKLRWMGYRPGDVVTANLPELGLVAQDILLTNRSLSPADGVVTMTARSETAAKHPYALGQTSVPPPTPSVTGPALVSTPAASAWALAGGQVAADNGTTRAALRLTGSADSDAIDAIVVEYRESAAGSAQAGAWISVATLEPAAQALTITGVKDQTAYDVSVSYRRNANAGGRLILGPAVAGQTAVPWQAGVVGPGKPADNATNSADPGSPFADTTVADALATIAAAREAAAAARETADDATGKVVDALDAITRGQAAQLAEQLLDEARDATARARDYLAGVPIGAALHQETTQRQDGHAAIVETVEQISARVDVGDSTSRALVRQAESARADGDAAEAAARLELAVEVATNALNAAAALVDEQTARADGDSAEATARLTLAASLTGLIADVDAALTEERSVRADRDSAEVTAREELAIGINTAIGNVDAALAVERTARADADHAEATSREELAVGINTAIGNVDAALAVERTARADADHAEATSREELAAGINTAIGNVDAAVAVVRQATADETGARVTAIEGLRAEVAGNLDARSSALIADYREADANEGEARTLAVNRLRSDLEGYARDQVSAAVTELDQTIADDRGAAAQRFASVQASVGQTAGEVTDLRDVVVGPDGSVLSRAVIQVGADGRVGGLYLTNNGQLIDLFFSVDRGGFLGLDGQPLFLVDTATNTVRMPNVIVQSLQAGSVTWDSLSGGLSSDASASWAGSITAQSLGEARTIPLGLSIAAVRPRGRFIMLDAQATIASDAGNRQQANWNGSGKTLYTQTVADWSIDAVAIDGAGNGYRAYGAKTQPVLASAAFDAVFDAVLRRGSTDTGVVDAGDTYRRTVSATPTISSMTATVMWLAT